MFVRHIYKVSCRLRFHFQAFCKSAVAHIDSRLTILQAIKCE